MRLIKVIKDLKNLFFKIVIFFLDWVKKIFYFKCFFINFFKDDSILDNLPLNSFQFLKNKINKNIISSNNKKNQNKKPKKIKNINKKKKKWHQKRKFKSLNH